MKFFLTYRRNGCLFTVELDGKNAVEALEIAAGFVEAAIRRERPVEFVSVTTK